MKTPILYFALAASALAQVFPGVEWQKDSPIHQGMDPAGLREFRQMVKGSGFIARNGYQVYAWGGQSFHHPWGSASKSIIASTMFFFAMNEGAVVGPEVQVRYYVQKQFPGEDLIEKDYPMTFFHLANAQSGYALPDDPGAKWAYNDYAYKLYKFLVLGQLLGANPNSGDSVRAAINDPSRLGPLQFQDFPVADIYNGSPHWTGTFRDTARVAWFWANRGRWGDFQLLPSLIFDTYVHAQTPPNLQRSESHVANDYLGIGTDGNPDPNTNTPNVHYGFNFNFNLGTDGSLISLGCPADLYMATGTSGNMIVVCPSLNLVLAMKAGYNITRPMRGPILDKLCSTVIQ